MSDVWLGVVDGILRPARPHLERCLEQRERHLAERRRRDDARARAIDDCVRRIESARARVFASADGVVTSEMTDLEREWRRLSRKDRDAGLMDLWARVVPASWMDRKLWRDSDAATQLDAAVALASDVEGVAAAEAAVASLRAAASAWDVRLGPRIRFRMLADDADPTSDLLVEPLRAASAGLRSSVLERAERLEHDVRDAMLARLPERPLLARSVARAAFVDVLWRVATVRDHANPAAALRALWTTGYVLAAADTSGVTLAIAALSSSSDARRPDESTSRSGSTCESAQSPTNMVPAIESAATRRA